MLVDNPLVKISILPIEGIFKAMPDQERRIFVAALLCFLAKHAVGGFVRKLSELVSLSRNINRYPSGLYTNLEQYLVQCRLRWRPGLLPLSLSRLLVIFVYFKQVVV